MRVLPGHGPETTVGRELPWLRRIVESGRLIVSRLNPVTKEEPMANLRITWLGHGGILYRSPDDAWVWVDRWTGAPTYPDAYRSAEQVNVVAPTHGHFDHVGDDLADVVELREADGAVVVSATR